MTDGSAKDDSEDQISLLKEKEIECPFSKEMLRWGAYIVGHEDQHEEER